MSEEQTKTETNPGRGIPEIQAQYQGICTRLGHTWYQIHALEKDTELMLNTLRDLNLEAARAQAIANATTPAPAAVDAPKEELPAEPQGDLVNA